MLTCLMVHNLSGGFHLEVFHTHTVLISFVSRCEDLLNVDLFSGKGAIHDAFRGHLSWVSGHCIRIYVTLTGFIIFSIGWLH